MVAACAAVSPGAAEPVGHLARLQPYVCNALGTDHLDDGLRFHQILLQQGVDLAALLSHDQRFFKDVVQRAAALDAKHAQ